MTLVTTVIVKKEKLEKEKKEADTVMHIYLTDPMNR